MCSRSLELHKNKCQSKMWGLNPQPIPTVWRLSFAVYFLSGNYVPRTPPYQGTTFQLLRRWGARLPPEPLLIRELRSFKYKFLNYYITNQLWN